MKKRFVLVTSAALLTVGVIASYIETTTAPEKPAGLSTEQKQAFCANNPARCGLSSTSASEGPLLAHIGRPKHKHCDRGRPCRPGKRGGRLYHG